MSFENKLKLLFRKKQALQELESERGKQKAIWQASGRQARKLSQEISLKTRELLESI